MPGKRRPSSAYAFFVGSTLRKKATRAIRLAWTAFVLFGLPLAGAFAVLVWVSDDIPHSASILDHRPSLTTFVHDARGRLVGSFAAEQRKLLPLAEISPAMRRAAISVEDERFYRHWGVDPWGILRAAVSNLRSRGISEGASTITQQLVRMLTHQRERSVKRKVVEAIAAVRLEMSLTKDQILERYLNQVYFGRGAYGVSAAARTYFDKEASELTVPEAALLAGLIQAPGRFRPFDNPGPSLERRAHVLWRMEVAGYLKPGEGGSLARSPLELRAPDPIRVGGHFLEHVRRQLEEMYGSETLYRGGLRVHTTLRLDAQEAAENAVREGIRRLVERRWPQRSKEPGWRPPEGALLALDVRSGAILAMAGGTDFGQSKFNRTVQALRQPGSSFKPIVYAAAVDMGFTPVDSVLDAPIVMEGGGGGLWKPENYSRNFSGRLSLREALAESRNTVSIRLVGALGMGRLIRFARSLGIRSEISPTLSSALGASAVTLQEMVSAYSVFASGGIHRAPYAIERIEDGEGRVIYRHEDRPEPAIRPEVAYVLTHMLKTVVQSGTARGAAVLGRPLAGKTGTTNEFRDNWFIGFTPDLAAGVWVGFDLPQPLGPGETGGRNAVPIFVDFFKAAGQDAPVRDFIPPPGVEFVRVDKETGLLATSATRKTGFEVFVQGTAPTQYADAGQRGTDAFFREDGLLPQRTAPASAR